MVEEAREAPGHSDSEPLSLPYERALVRFEATCTMCAFSSRRPKESSTHAATEEHTVKEVRYSTVAPR